MAVLTASELAELRNGVANSGTQSWTRAQVNAALQAVEDYFEDTARAGFGSAIEAAAPGVFTNAQKKRIGAYWLLQKYRREGV
jgi:hypothetical protein